MVSHLSLISHRLSACRQAAARTSREDVSPGGPNDRVCDSDRVAAAIPASPGRFRSANGSRFCARLWGLADERSERDRSNPRHKREERHAAVQSPRYRGFGFHSQDPERIRRSGGSARQAAGLGRTGRVPRGRRAGDARPGRGSPPGLPAGRVRTAWAAAPTTCIGCRASSRRIDLGLATAMLAVALGTDPMRVGCDRRSRSRSGVTRIANEGLIVAYGGHRARGRIERAEPQDGGRADHGREPAGSPITS